jgi:uroporphyrinogen decarboxylase
LELEGCAKVDEESKVVYDSWGMGIRVGSDGFFACFHPLEKQQTDAFAEKWMPARIRDAVTAPTLEERIRKYTPPDPDQPGIYEWVQRDIDRHGQQSFVFPSGYFGIFERSYGLISIPSLFDSMVTEPNLVAELFEKVTEYKLGVTRHLVTMDLDAMHFGDDLGTQTGPFFAPRLFTTLLKPCYQRLWDVCKEADKSVMMHSCGCVGEFLSDLVEMGLDVLEPCQPCNDLARFKAEYGERLVFWGGIDTQKLLPFGTPNDIRREATQVIRTLGKGGGHIIGPSQEVMKDVPLANVVALIETIVEQRGKTLAD